MSKNKKPRKPRAYEPIWNKLKSTGTCKVWVPKPHVARVKKAVIKEKWMDDAHKELYNGDLSIEVKEFEGQHEVLLVFKLELISKFI